MKGGKRAGAGRKRSEPTVCVRVPVGVLDQVQALIAAHKGGPLNAVTEIKPTETARDIPLLKQAALPVHQVTENKRSDKPASALTPEIIAARKELERLSGMVKKVLVKSFGTLSNAALLGIRAKPDGGFHCPDDLEHRLKIPPSLHLRIH
jgi:hypothetical protein